MPKLTREDQVGKIAVNHVQRVFTAMNWNTNELFNDVGEDLHVEPFDSSTGALLPVTEFKVQVKGRTCERLIENEPSISIGSGHVMKWVCGHVPVLLILCHIEGTEVRSAWFHWTDEYVYGAQKWPLGAPGFRAPRTVTFRFDGRQVFDKTCQEQLLAYLREWGSAAKTESGIGHYLMSERQKTLDRYPITRGGYRWDLFALPMKYERQGEGQICSVEGEDNLLDCGRRTILLLGKPATGKTTTIQRLYAQQSQGVIPVSIREILPTDVDEVCQHVLRTVGISSRRHVEHLQSQGRLLLIVDGLNEMHQSERIVKNIRDLAYQLPETRFIATCRTADYGSIGGLEEFDSWEIAPLDESAQEGFLSTQPPKTQSAVWDAFSKDPELRELCSNQFLFLMAVELLPTLRGQPLRRADLYNRFLAKYWKWMKVTGLSPQQLEDLLSTIAFEMRRSKTGGTCMRDSILRRLITREINTRYQGSDRRAVETTLYKYGLVERKGGYLQFWQETLQEYLCARYLVTNRILPCHMECRSGRWSYKGLSVEDMVRSFYLELSGFQNLSPDDCGAVR